MGTTRLKEQPAPTPVARTRVQEPELPTTAAAGVVARAPAGAGTFRPPALPILARDDKDKNQTPQGTVEDLKKQLPAEVKSRTAAVQTAFWKAFDGLVGQAPEIAKEPIDSYEQRAKAGAQAFVDQAAGKLQSFAESEINELAKSLIAQLKPIAQKIKADVADSEIVSAIAEEVARVVKEIYEKDSATFTKVIKTKLGKLAGHVKFDNVTSGVQSVYASLELASASYSIKLSTDGSTFALDARAAFSANNKLGLYASSGGQFAVNMTFGSTTAPVQAKLGADGQGSGTVPEVIKTAVLEAKVDKAVSAAAGVRLMLIKYGAAGGLGTPPPVITQASLEAKVRAQLGSGWEASIDAKYANRIFSAGIQAGMKLSAGAFEESLAAEVAIQITNSMNLYFNAGLSTKGGQSPTATAGAGIKGKNWAFGVAAVRTGKDGEVTVMPTFTFTIPGS